MSKRKKTFPIPAILAMLGVLLLITAVLMIMVWNARAPETPTALTFQSEEVADPETGRVSLDEAKAAYESKTAIFVDVRSVENYAESHIPGAKSIPLVELETRLEELGPSQWIITYCT